MNQGFTRYELAIRVKLSLLCTNYPHKSKPKPKPTRQATPQRPTSRSNEVNPEVDSTPSTASGAAGISPVGDEESDLERDEEDTSNRNIASEVGSNCYREFFKDDIKLLVDISRCDSTVPPENLAPDGYGFVSLRAIVYVKYQRCDECDQYKEVEALENHQRGDKRHRGQGHAFVITHIIEGSESDNIIWAIGHTCTSLEKRQEFPLDEAQQYLTLEGGNNDFREGFSKQPVLRIDRGWRMKKESYVEKEVKCFSLDRLKPWRGHNGTQGNTMVLEPDSQECLNSNAKWPEKCLL